MLQPAVADLNVCRVKGLPVPAGFAVRKLYEMAQKNHDEISYMEATATGDKLLRALSNDPKAEFLGTEQRGLQRRSPVVGRDGWYFQRKSHLRDKHASWIEYKNTAWVWDRASSQWPDYFRHLAASNTGISTEVVYAMALVVLAGKHVPVSREQHAIVRWYQLRRDSRITKAEARRHTKLLKQSGVATIIKLIAGIVSNDNQQR